MTRLATQETHHSRPVPASRPPGWPLQRRRPDRKQIRYQYFHVGKTVPPRRASCTDWSFPIRCCIKSSNSEGIGVTFGGDTTGVGRRCCSNDSNSSWAAGVISSAAPGRSSPAFPHHLSYKREGADSTWGTTPLGPPNQHDTRHRSTISHIGVSRRRCAMWPISPKAFMANVSNSIANIDGSVPAAQMIFSNCRR